MGKYTVKWLEDNLGEMRYYMHQAFTGNIVGIYQTMVNKKGGRINDQRRIKSTD